MSAKRTYSILSWISLAAIILIGYNSIVNIHSHKIRNGWYITHAHPYQIPIDATDSASGHSHSSTSYVYLDQIFDLLEIIIIVAFLGFLFIASDIVAPIRPITKRILFQTILCNGGRGPPRCDW